MIDMITTFLVCYYFPHLTTHLKIGDQAIAFESGAHCGCVDTSGLDLRECVCNKLGWVGVVIMIRVRVNVECVCVCD